MCSPAAGPGTGTPPGGVSPKSGKSTNGQATCCPDVAEFKKRSNKLEYFGFDDKTNMVQPTTQPYWVPTDKSKKAPSDRLTRDGAVWLSVEKGQSTKCTIKFTNKLGCITNCTYEVKPSGVATVVTSVITVDNAMFEIRGEKKGDCTVIVKCDGKDRGWVHVACHERKTYRVGICEINQFGVTPADSSALPESSLVLPRPTIDVALYQRFFDECYRAACVKVVLTGLPRHNVPASVDLSPGGGFFDANGQMESPQHRTRYATGIYPVADQIYATVSAANPNIDKFLFLMIPPGPRVAGKRYLNGFARGIGGNFAMFFNSDAGTYSTAAHEFGHLINLRHPNDPAATSQFPVHLRAGAGNVPSNDTLNLMGYGGPRPNRKELRYSQWKSVQGR